MSATVVGLDGVLARIEVTVAAYLAARHEAALEIASLLADYAKGHHPWTPQTGNTDTSTFGRIAEEATSYVLVALGAGMDYDVFLELARDGAWAWLQPAVEANRAAIQEIIRTRMAT